MGRIISDRMSYRNHYMCSGGATSLYNFRLNISIFGQLFDGKLFAYIICINQCFSNWSLTL